MKQIRIHNDIHFSWSIMQADGSGYILTGKDLRLWMISSGLEIEVTDFSVEDNRISWDFLGKDQSKLGQYDAILCENYGKEGMITVDAEGIVCLVTHTDYEGGLEPKAGISATSVTVGTSIWGHNPDWPGDFWVPRLEIDTDGDHFLAWGETMHVKCSVVKGFIDITDTVLGWAVTRDSGDAAEDAAWALKQKVVAFRGELDIAFKSSENDLSTVRQSTKFTFTAYLPNQLEANFNLVI